MSVASFFQFKQRGTNLKTEILAGVTVFVMTCYIFALNPSVLSQSGMNASAVFCATGIASVLSMLVMGASANLPVVMSGGMGLNAFLVYTVCKSMGYPYQTGLTALAVTGVLFMLLSQFKIRDAVVDSLPASLKSAVSAGIGLFIAFVGLQGAGLVVASAGTFVSLGDLHAPKAMLAVFGLLLTFALFMRRVRGGFLIGILGTTLAGIPLGVTKIPADFTFFSVPAAPLFCDFSFDGVLSVDFVLICFTFLFLNVFDTLGTLLAVCGQAGILQKDGSVPKIRQAFFSAGFGTFVGAVFGTTVTCFIESSSAVAEGGRTGVSAICAAVLFAVALFLSPVFLLVPYEAVAPVLVIIGFLMAGSLKNIDFSNAQDGFPAFVCLLAMVTTYSIVNGIVFGLLTHVFCAAVAGRARQIRPFTWILCAVCLIKLAV